MANPTNDAQHVGHFALSITAALREQLTTAVETLTPAPLTPSMLAAIDESPGVYQLYRSGRCVYVGKADKNLRRRLGEHYTKVSGRTGISVDEMTFLAMHIEEDLSVLSPEAMLIQHNSNQNPIWNQNGFGNNDPGKERDTSEVKDHNFDAIHPIDLERLLTIDFTGQPADGVPLDTLKKLIKDTAPFTVRIGQDLTGKNYVPAAANEQRTALKWIALLTDLMEPRGTKPACAVALPGRVIIYHRSALSFPSRMAHYASGDGEWTANPDRVYPTPKSLLDTGDGTAASEGQ